jgi:hypothetical protein
MSLNEIDQLIRRTIVKNLINDFEALPGEDEAAMDLNHSQLSTHQFDEAVTMARESMSVEAVKRKTLIFLIVKDTHDIDNNRHLQVPCNDGYGLGGYAKVRDVANDCYLVEGVEVCPLGSVPFTFSLTMPSSSGWRVHLPIPDRVVDKYMAPFFRRQVRELRQKFSRPRYDWHYFQIVACD